MFSRLFGRSSSEIAHEDVPEVKADASTSIQADLIPQQGSPFSLSPSLTTMALSLHLGSCISFVTAAMSLDETSLNEFILLSAAYSLVLSPLAAILYHRFGYHFEDRPILKFSLLTPTITTALNSLFYAQADWWVPGAAGNMVSLLIFMTPSVSRCLSDNQGCFWSRGNRRITQQEADVENNLDEAFLPSDNNVASI